MEKTYGPKSGWAASIGVPLDLNSGPPGLIGSVAYGHSDHRAVTFYNERQTVNWQFKYKNQFI